MGSLYFTKKTFTCEVSRSGKRCRMSVMLRSAMYRISNSVPPLTRETSGGRSSGSGCAPRPRSLSRGCTTEESTMAALAWESRERMRSHTNSGAPCTAASP
eukprot:TRINITY_DN3839_c1_g1_i4.p3 TRINITY_DN3839_c1_g1~~TRINITY_DN3839_c1_g1_i4.p3  ORF type:complete len:101 (-),score=6.37 TRINITY_DN3839_c1_g1_i4:272-574(-)